MIDFALYNQKIETLSDQELFEIYRSIQKTILTSTGKIDWEMDQMRGALRLKLLPEVNRRGRALLKANGWPGNDESQYVNIHTGTVNTLYQVLNPWGKDEYEDIYVVLEHWLPLEQAGNCNKFKSKGTQFSLFE